MKTLDTFYTREDLVKKYADKRKGLSEEEVEDLLDCVLGYLKTVTSGVNDYSVRIGKLGYLYKKYQDEMRYLTLTQKSHKRGMMNNMMLEAVYSEGKWNPILRKDLLKRRFKNLEIEEIQNIVNSEED